MCHPTTYSRELDDRMDRLIKEEGTVRALNAGVGRLAIVSVK